MDNTKLWSKFLDSIKPQISSANFRAFFSTGSIENVSDSKVTLSTPSAFIKQTLTQRHLELIESTLGKLLERKIFVEFIIKDSQKPLSEENSEDIFQPAVTVASYLNPRFTLENFVVGPSNNVAFAAAQAVVQNPGISYNPLFIYGGTGVGKTHLMIAIGNALSKKNHGTKVICCSSEKFMNDFVGAIQTHKMGDLRNKYRSTDILLIDDIQFFSGREGTQEEFFHTFNELTSKNSQMIFTSDRPPGEIEKLEDRLKSRFAGGLMVDMQQPDFDTRVAILRAKCLAHGESLSEDTLTLLASSFDTNIRELEGRLVQILQILKAKGLSPTTENINAQLGPVTQKSNMRLDPKLVLKTVAGYFNLTNSELTGPKRQKELVLPRHITMYILSDILNMTVESIGRILGGRDHTTIMHGRDKIKTLALNDRDVQRMLIEIKSKLTG